MTFFCIYYVSSFPYSFYSFKWPKQMSSVNDWIYIWYSIISRVSSAAVWRVKTPASCRRNIPSFTITTTRTELSKSFSNRKSSFLTIMRPDYSRKEISWWWVSFFQCLPIFIKIIFGEKYKRLLIFPQIFHLQGISKSSCYHVVTKK